MTDATLTLATGLTEAFGPERAELAAAELGLHTVGDLVRHFPFRYEGGAVADEGDRASEPRVGDDVVILGEIVRVRPTEYKQQYRRGQGKGRGRPMKLFRMTVRNKVRQYEVSFFAHMDGTMRVGRRVLLSGRLGTYGGNLQLTHPDWLLVPSDTLSPEDALRETLAALESDSSADSAGKGSTGKSKGGKGKGRRSGGTGKLQYARLDLLLAELVPVYHATKAMPTWLIMSMVADAIDRLAPVRESLDVGFLAAHGLMDLDEALRVVHRPPGRSAVLAARRRIAYDEAVAIETQLARRAYDVGETRAPALGGGDDALEAELLAQLPFSLTDGQESVLSEIVSDLSRTHPMTRLLQGEVGSGKTLVALLAMLRAVDAGRQAVLLAPTEVLATQHHLSISKMLGPLARAGQLGAAERATTVTLLTGSMSTKARRAALLRIVTGEAGIVIGTHALLEDTVDYFDLGLVVVDEQHRFGVEQRDRLRSKGRDGATPHLLVMTATPIPRTIALTQFGDMQTSLLRELPRGRQPIQTSVVHEKRGGWLARMWERVGEEVASGRQVYVVCPRIGDDETADGGTDFTDEEYYAFDAPSAAGKKPAAAPAGQEEAPDEQKRDMISAVDQYEELVSGPLGRHRVGLLHGRLPADEKAAVMAGFASGAIDVLVSTTVIEVGVDVANATTMVVRDAERFGLSQLHQLRGRVGRGGLPGLCLLTTDTTSGRTMERLEKVAGTVDGFEIAQLDLEYRGYGDILGVDQSGTARRLSFLDLARDAEILDAAREYAFDVIGADPELAEHPELRAMNDVVLGGERADYLGKA
ncbi:ATP-dependent DNA helicase RecG [Tsukamurella sp. 8F]|uniref:ATP-dependent DNA helicase RecG n=1 Tax=unclassified Tsukamurella TaxID=2633480 RepID=UPI0023B8A35C|nr:MULTISPECIES: ATP-dependent DNA helicase RecG [unclassified Tsukamurella]MDF0532092.1 ATP-dependent DNA helicase RecG [Tsukamurella sp. 8J]MDF0589230.1 ATP-dependent DNA helicase RecG [Tsukamurella sp. 8F]